MQFNPLKSFYFLKECLQFGMEKDELLCCEPCAVDVFSGTTRSTFVRAGCKMGESSRKPVNKQQYAYYGVDKRAICVTGLTINLPRDLRKEY